MQDRPQSDQVDHVGDAGNSAEWFAYVQEQLRQIHTKLDALLARRAGQENLHPVSPWPGPKLERPKAG